MTWWSEVQTQAGRCGRGAAGARAGPRRVSHCRRRRSSTPVPGAYYGEWYEEKDREKDAKPREFILINYFFTRLRVHQPGG